MSTDLLAFRGAFREYLDSAVTEGLRTEISQRDSGEVYGTPGPHMKAWYQKLGRDGYLGISWPKEYGGKGLSIAFTHEAQAELFYRDLPFPYPTINMIGPSIIRFGSDQQKRDLLPKMLRAELEFCIGYTEPDAGTDLASLRTRAVRNGDEYVITGQKIFTSGAGGADYIWLAARTDLERHKHRGVSLLLVPMDSPGIEIQSIPIMSGSRTYITHLRDVRVPVSALVGAENEGWRVITSQLNLERLTVCPVPALERTVDGLRKLIKRNLLCPGDDAWVASSLADMVADVNVLKLMYARIADSMDRDEVRPEDASLLKVMSTEARVRHLMSAQQMLELVARKAPADSEVAQLRGHVEAQIRLAPIRMFGGGTNDIQRDLVAKLGLRL